MVIDRFLYFTFRKRENGNERERLNFIGQVLNYSTVRY